jgi:hypothetical protein
MSKVKKLQRKEKAIFDEFSIDGGKFECRARLRKERIKLAAFSSVKNRKKEMLDNSK